MVTHPLEAGIRDESEVQLNRVANADMTLEAIQDHYVLEQKIKSQPGGIGSGFPGSGPN